ncbi:MAG: SDR family oxidoreductase [Candidatus Rokubacteria bacterium]|nr:SDR family oxidoreductase [Candidatus Rokubacteria bacterium]
MDTLELGLKGKVAIITGGSEGLGRATVERFARSGAKIAMCARRADVLDAAAKEIQKATGADILAMPTDVTKQDQCEKLVSAVIGRWGGVDVLLNNAGTSQAQGFMDVTDETWQYDFDLKVMGAVRMCRLAIPSMKSRGGGAIINVTTIGGKAPAPKALPTSLTRAAGINLTKSLAKEYAAEQIRVNTICLGQVKSAQWTRRAKGGDIDAFYAQMAKDRGIPLGRLGEAEEFADLVAFLASERARWITGTAINFDGGAAAVV